MSKNQSKLAMVAFFFGIISNASEKEMLYNATCLGITHNKSTFMSFSEDGSQCVSHTPQGTTTLYDFDSKKREQLSVTHDGQSLCPSIVSGCKTLLAFPCNQKRIGVYNVKNKALSAQFDMPAEILDITFDENSSKLYCAYDNQTKNEALICSYDIQTQQKYGILRE